jgi:hypothetical protein
LQAHTERTRGIREKLRLDRNAENRKRRVRFVIVTVMVGRRSTLSDVRVDMRETTMISAVSSELMMSVCASAISDPPITTKNSLALLKLQNVG